MCQALSYVRGHFGILLSPFYRLRKLAQNGVNFCCLQQHDGPGEYYAFSKINQRKTDIIYCHVYVESKNKKANIMKQIHRERKGGRDKIR